MQLPFTAEQFFGVFRDYNLSVAPAQFFLLALGVLAFLLVFAPRRWSGALISAILALLWAWIGLAYHLVFFAPINPLAPAFAALSVVGAMIFVWFGIYKRQLEFVWAPGARSAMGLALILYAVVVYPLWTTWTGHGYPEVPTFGLPCPTTLFTLGMLAFLKAPYPRSPLVVPILWSLIGSQAAFLLGVRADLGLVVAGIFGIMLLVRSKARRA